MWAHAIGKPAERVQFSADVTMNQKLDEERELLGRLSVEQLDVLQAQSQALVNAARAMAKANALTPNPATAHRAPVVRDAGAKVRGPADTGIVATHTGDGDHPVLGNGAEATARPVDVPPSSVARDDVVPDGPAE